MKRIGMVLPLAAASVLTCSLAFAEGGDEPTDIKSEAWKHIVVTVIAGLLPPLIKSLNEGTQNLPTLAAPFRLVIIGVLGFIATAVEQWGTGLDIVNVLVTLAMTMGPSLLIELVHALWGGWPKNSVGPGGKFGIKRSNFPPQTTLIMLIVSMAFPLGAIQGCAMSREVKAVVRDVASEVMEDAAQANAILDVLHSVSDVFFFASPDAAKQAHVEQYFVDARLAAEMAIDLAKGVNTVAAGDYNAAFANFRQAYSRLMTILNDLGIVSKASGGKMSVNRRGGGTNEIPVPRASMPKVAK